MVDPLAGPVVALVGIGQTFRTTHLTRLHGLTLILVGLRSVRVETVQPSAVQCILTETFQVKTKAHTFGKNRALARMAIY